MLLVPVVSRDHSPEAIEVNIKGASDFSIRRLGFSPLLKSDDKQLISIPYAPRNEHNCAETLGGASFDAK